MNITKMYKKCSSMSYNESMLYTNLTEIIYAAISKDDCYGLNALVSSDLSEEPCPNKI